MSGTEYDPRDHPAFGVVDGEVITSLRTAGWHLVGSTDLDADDLAWMHKVEGLRRHIRLLEEALVNVVPDKTLAVETLRMVNETLGRPGS